ncbi:hypothetical protein [Streptococcus mutans]|uniref:hypothetical protein n=1 Tax=Streptococcus mutans TaxID=1309 RepID=UPI0020D1F544|nr:hypothetical protein [Streptococcus mutans]MCY7116318.1 hypothetical protein [Streptococcus mutans]
MSDQIFAYFKDKSQTIINGTFTEWKVGRSLNKRTVSLLTLNCIAITFTKSTWLRILIIPDR